MPPASPAKPRAANGRFATSKEGAKLVAHRHAEWREHQLTWRWLCDSLEGGERYRRAIYGLDRRGLPVRNLIRHKREYPDPKELSANFAGLASGAMMGEDIAAATTDDYELRLARTPVPTFVSEAITDHLDRVYAREVGRDGPAPLVAWWADVDGKGTPIDAWLHDLVAPLLLATGVVDVLIDRPPAPEGAVVASLADERSLGLDRAEATFVLPENMVWWKLDRKGRYAEALVREYPDGDDQPAAFLGHANVPVQGRDTAKYRHWTALDSTLYDSDGNVIRRTPHAFGCVPIVRLFARKKARCGNVGQSPYEGIAERMREYYNRDSELILSDTIQAHPLLQGPEDFVQADGTISIGPTWLLPKKKNQNGTSSTYEGFDYVDPPKGGADSLRENKRDIRSDVDRDAALSKPAGMNGAGIVSQSGLSKGFDNERLNNKLSCIADMLATAEKALAALALVVLGQDAGAASTLKINYSKQFDLTDVEDLGQYANALLSILENPAAALVPTISAAFLEAMVRQALPGREDGDYAAFDAEIEAGLKQAKADADKMKQANLDAMANPEVPA